MDNKLNIGESLIDRLIEESNLPDLGTASIREIVRLANQVEKESGEKLIRMEMGVPGLVPASIGVNAEIDALRRGVGAIYPNIEGIPELRDEASRFIKLFLNIDIAPSGIVPTVGSMMGAMIGFLVANRNDASKEGTLFIDPGFPVQKQQVRILGQDHLSFDIYKYRGEKLRDKLESYLKTGRVSTILYSNPNNPSWICFTEDELKIIGELATRYDAIVMEDLAYFGMDFRKDYSVPGVKPFQPTVANYTDNYMLLISSSKIFSYAGQRIGLLAVSNKLFSRKYPDLKRYYSSDSFGHSVVYGALYALSSGVTHSVQYGLAALLKAVNDGDYRFIDDVSIYGEKARRMKKIFLDHGFNIVYDHDMDDPIADGFYFTLEYPGLNSGELLRRLLSFGISAISLRITGSESISGIRACVSQIPFEMFDVLEERVKLFRESNPIKQ